MNTSHPATESGHGKPEVFFTRHSKSTYGTYGAIVSSDTPTQSFDPEKQVLPDLSDSGVDLARKEAAEFFHLLDPDHDILFFTSSNEARAIETANIYRDVAKARGFQLIKPKNRRNGLSNTLSDGDIRVVRALSIYPDKIASVLTDTVFNSPAKRGDINWSSVDPDVKEKFEAASQIIEADDKGSFGPNMAQHGEQIKQILPNIHTAQELFETRFRDILRLMKFGIKKAAESGGEKRIKILAFGHENYLMFALKKYFDAEGINNCETIQFTQEGETIEATFRDTTQQII